MENDDENMKTEVSSEEKEDLVAVDDVKGIKISDDVVSVIAGVAASEVPGVCSMSGGIGFSEVFGKKNMAKGIRAEVGEKETKIDVNIIVEYGVRIPDIAYEIQNRVKTAVESMTGLKVSEVNIHVQGVQVMNSEKAPEDKNVDIVD